MWNVPADRRLAPLHHQSLLLLPIQGDCLICAMFGHLALTDLYVQGGCLMCVKFSHLAVTVLYVPGLRDSETWHDPANRQLAPLHHQPLLLLLIQASALMFENSGVRRLRLSRACLRGPSCKHASKSRNQDPESRKSQPCIGEALIMPKGTSGDQKFGLRVEG